MKEGRGFREGADGRFIHARVGTASFWSSSPIGGIRAALSTRSRPRVHPIRVADPMLGVLRIAAHEAYAELAQYLCDEGVSKASTRLPRFAASTTTFVFSRCRPPDSHSSSVSATGFSSSPTAPW